jgi:dynein heavy chain 2
MQLDDLFNPSTFLNAVRQQTARQLKRSIDDVKLVCSWEANGKDPGCKLPFSVTGLRLQGAEFVGSRLTHAGAQELAIAPDVQLGFIPSEAQEPYDESKSFCVPVYNSITRAALLMELKMPIDGPEDARRWILAGVALCLSVIE